MDQHGASPTIIVLGGVNGAGKTTASRSLLANTLKVMTFVNADVIAQGLSGFDPDAAAIRAGRIMLKQLKDLAAQRANFAFETTLAGKVYGSWLSSLRDSGYAVHLFYFWLNDVEMAIARVATRARKGGHRVADAVIRQRYDRSIRNLFGLYMPVVSSWKVYDNSSAGSPVLVAEGARGTGEVIHYQDAWLAIRSVGNG
jgi:predicted ABC-type ATPase